MHFRNFINKYAFTYKLSIWASCVVTYQQRIEQKFYPTELDLAINSMANM
jgi:hypothetical protein